MSDQPRVRLYADGACSGNPGPGGWAFILEDVLSGKSLEAAGAERETTNNRMEMRAVIEGFRRLKQPSRVTVTSDSQYVTLGMTTWIDGWIRNGWRTADKKPVKNQEVWRELLEVADPHTVKWEWVRGHAGHPQNERCDQLAVEAMRALMAGK